MYKIIGSVMGNIVDFFNHPFFIIIGGIATLVMIIGFLYTAFLIVKKVIPVWYRLGIGLSKRKIAIFALVNEFTSLRKMLIESGIFEEKNIMQIHLNDINSAANETLFLVHWKDYKDKIDDILAIKKDSTALVIYAPQSEGSIEPMKIMDKINSHRNTIVVNFRGRLLNDLFISLITTIYEKR